MASKAGKPELWIFLAIAFASVPILFCGGCVFLFGATSGRPSSPESQRITNARVAARLAVKSYLSAPATAEFPRISPSINEKHGVIEGIVKYQNEFGVPLESRFLVVGVVGKSNDFSVAMVSIDERTAVYDPDALAAYREVESD